jgi:hypothetical protein
MRRFIGLLLLAIAIAAVAFYELRKKPGSGGTPATATTAGHRDLSTVKGFVGSEKIGFLEDPQVKQMLADRYGLAVDYTKRGSIEMATGDVAGMDFLWPSSQFAAEEFRKRRPAGEREAKTDTIFNSPLVFYSWTLVTDALQHQNVLEKRGETYYLTDAPGLVKIILDGKKWKDIGAPQLYGRVTIYSTDPTRSNSGTMFAGLLATLLNEGDVVDEHTVEKQLPALRQFFAKMGYMEASSGDLFKQFLNTGVGANPIIVGYENQMIEYTLDHQDQIPVLKQSVRVIYPQPTMWSSHPLISLSDAGRRLLEALKDRDIQRLAWERHGFRSGLLGAQNDASVLKVAGVPAHIESVVPMPSSAAMEKILDALRTSAPPAQANP